MLLLVHFEGLYMWICDAICAVQNPTMDTNTLELFDFARLTIYLQCFYKTNNLWQQMPSY